MACRVVEHDDATRKPKPGGRSEPSTVHRLTDSGVYVQVRTTRWGLMSFWAETGWAAWDASFRWRLLPGTGEEAATAAPRQED
jgi:hypothetical protein